MQLPVNHHEMAINKAAQGMIIIPGISADFKLKILTG